MSGNEQDMSNLHSLFYKEYFTANSVEEIRKCNEKILGRTFQPQSEETLFPLPGYQEAKFIMRTTYPGLLVGTGYPHEGHWEEQGDADEKKEKKTDVAIKLGFMLDYVTGMPVIPGSSVKGVLRSAFKRYPDDKEKGTPGFVRELLESGDHAEKYNGIDIAALEQRIFDNGDIFFDAVIIASDAKKFYTKAGANTPVSKPTHRIFGFDSITHHPGKTKNPNPVRLLKVLPGVHFEFRFWFRENGIIEAEDKRQLFIDILENLGIGAKTNTGYGYMRWVEDVL